MKRSLPEKVQIGHFLYLVNRTVLWMSILSGMGVIIQVGFDLDPTMDHILDLLVHSTLYVGAVSIGIRYFDREFRPQRKVWTIDAVFLLYLLLLIISQNHLGTRIFGSFSLLELFTPKGWVYTAIYILLFRELSTLQLNLRWSVLNPAQLFLLSFLSLIVLGTGLLMLPNATHSEISFIDALFTSTSAVCVTGLIVVDTGSFFTYFGQVIIAILIQLGGLGIMTFASYFSYFFSGKYSFETQLMLSDITKSEKVDEVFEMLKKIILLTFIIEGIGGLIIYFNLPSDILTSFSERFFFSVFHAISGFCNEGFSTLSNSLYEVEFRFNYPIHLTIAILFIIGGIGFPIAFNFMKYLRYLFMNRFIPFFKGASGKHLPWVLNLNAKLVLVTTGLLIGSATLFFYILEYDNTLSGHSFSGKWIGAFFGAVTPRTAGFNTVDTSLLTFPTTMLVMLLMWIGASPASTGGGIKTSTFAVAVLNFLSLAKGKDRIEVFRRRISIISVRRAFAFMALSFLMIGSSVFLVAIFDNDMSLLDIGFECFSAFGTVGLSRGITSDLSFLSKWVIIVTMFIGRVGMLTILVALFRQVRDLSYNYPTEDILIN